MLLEESVSILELNSPNSQSNCTHFKSWSLLMSAVIHNYPEEGAIFPKKCDTWKDCCHISSELSSDNGQIGPRRLPYHPEAFVPCGSGWFFFGLGTKKSSDPSCFFPFLLSFHPPPRGSYIGVFLEHFYSVTKPRPTSSLGFWY